MDCNEWLGRNYLEITNSCYPTVAQIQSGIINFQQERLECMYQSLLSEKELDELLYNHQLAWELFFYIAVDYRLMNTEISPTTLEATPNDPIVQMILFIYSMETFLPEEINKASTTRNHDAVITLGPFAFVLGEINNAANQKRTDMKQHDESSYQIITYRGTRMSQDEIDENFLFGKSFEIRGFCSTSAKRDLALNTIMQEPASGTPINSQQ